MTARFLNGDPHCLEKNSFLRAPRNRLRRRVTVYHFDARNPRLTRATPGNTDSPPDLPVGGGARAGPLTPSAGDGSRRHSELAMWRAQPDKKCTLWHLRSGGYLLDSGSAWRGPTSRP